MFSEMIKCFSPMGEADCIVPREMDVITGKLGIDAKVSLQYLSAHTVCTY